MTTNHHRPLAALAAGLLAVGLTLGGATPAQAKVKARDLPSKSQIVSAVPALKGGKHVGHELAYMYVPAPRCGGTNSRAVKSARFSVVSTHNHTRSAGVDVAQFAKRSQAKEAFRQHRRYVAECPRTVAENVTIKVKRRSIPSWGAQRIAYLEKNTGTGFGPDFHWTVVVRKGKRVAVVSADRPKKAWPKKRVKKLARVAVRKMR